MGNSGSITAAGVAFLLALVLTGWAGLFALLTPSFLLLLVPGTDPIKHHIKAFYRLVVRFVQWMWMGNVAFLLEKLFGMQVRIYGDAATKSQEATVRNGESALWFSNHRTRIDWMLLWSVLLRTNTLDKIRIVLKAPLRKIPIFGWAMQHFIFIFLQRKWADDQVNLQKLLPFLTKNEPQTSYLIFPEGTDLSEENLEKSAAFAKKSGLEERKYSLYPRTTGWTFMFPLLREKLSAVYDVTMFYEDFSLNERPSEKALLSARMPRKIHVYIERVDINMIDNDQAKLAEWMEARFTRKEAHLKQFYEENCKLPDGAQPMLQDDQTAAFSVLAAFWVVLISLIFQYVWVFGWFGVSLAVTVAIAYGYATAFLSGVDGYQIDNL
ncbi:Lysocardiolipin acyltransferase, partial [Globisporangium splendens]